MNSAYDQKEYYTDWLMMTTTVVRVHEGQTVVKGVGPYYIIIFWEIRILYDVYTGYYIVTVFLFVSYI